MSAGISQIRILAVDDRPLFRLVLILLIAAFSWQWGMAETAVPQAQRIIHESWTFKDGAPEGVSALAQTADGFLWLGAPAGLVRFDGVRFEPFRSPFGDQLLSTYVFALFAPPTGGLWVGYAFGGFSFIKNGRVTNFAHDTGSVYSFAQDKNGVVWAGTGGGLWRFDGSAWQHITAVWNAPVTNVCQVRFDRDGTLWVLTDSLRSDVGKRLFYLLPGGTQFRNAGNNLFVEGFTLDADNLVLTTHERGGPAGSGINLEESLPAYPLLKRDSDQMLDRNNGIWSMLRSALVLRHPVGASVSETLSNASPGNSDAYNMDPFRYAHIVDREGSIWLGDQNGVHRFSYSPLIRQEFPKAEAAPFFALAPDEGGMVWVSAGNGNGLSHLYRAAYGKAELQRSQEGVNNIAYRAMDKSLWFAGEGGLWHMVNGSLTRISLPPEVAANAKFFQTITQDRSGGMWVSTGRSSLYRYADGVWTPYGGRRDLRKGIVIEFTDKLGGVWFGYTKSRLAVLDGDLLKTFGPSDGIRVGNITAIYGRGAEIWIGGEFGLQQFDHGKFHNIEAVDKEWLRGISGIVETANGDLWLNGLGGIFHISRAELQEALQDPAHQVSGERFGRREGLPGLAQQVAPLLSAIEGTDGRLWFVVTNGVVWLDPAQASNRIPPPPVTVQSVAADDRGYRLDGPLQFRAHTSSVQISYAAISLSDPEAIRFRYKLRETDKDWHDVGRSTSVSYRNLLPGSYHFVVSASDTNGLWSDNTATAEFTVLPAFYQTNWFRALCAVFLLALLWAAYQWRVRQLQHQFDMTLEARVGERTRIARDLHDTLLQSFHGLLLRFQTVFQLLPERPMEAKEKLGSAIEQAAEAITEGRDAVQGLRASTVQSNDLALAISTLGEELATDSTNHRPAFRVAVEGEARNLHPILRDEIYKIAAEALRNAFRHSQSRQIEVEIRYDNEQFRLRVRDDGKGIDPAILSSQGSKGHYGLPGMRERATLMGGQLVVWSEVDAGTEVELRVSARKAYATAQRRSWLSRKLVGNAKGMK
jgi:signal transduction histidine kinase/ligand-binding sensor domain-containing protein